jgi:pyrrolidone-carboxylate peptidase
VRVLVYGFGPYRQFRDNITQKIARRLARRRGLKKIVFAVRFHRTQFIDAIKKHDPDIILGLGQCSQGRQLRIETRAVNARRSRKEERVKKIVGGGAAGLATDLRLFLGRSARRSRYAGDYVCNYSMYVMLDFIKRQEANIRYGFVHIPHDYDPRKAVELLNGAIERLAARS